MDSPYKHHRLLLPRQRCPRRAAPSPPEVTCSTDIWTSWARCHRSDSPGGTNTVFRMMRDVTSLTISIIHVPESYSKRAGTGSKTFIRVR